MVSTYAMCFQAKTCRQVWFNLIQVVTIISQSVNKMYGNAVNKWNPVKQNCSM